MTKNISGQVKLEVKHKCPGSGAEVTGGGVSNIDSGKVTAAVDIKSKRCPGTGTQLTSKWTTDNVLNTSLDIQVRNMNMNMTDEVSLCYINSVASCVQDKLMSGLRVTLDTFLNPDTGSKNGRLKAELRTAAALLSLDTDLNLGGPVLQSAAVLGHKVELEHEGRRLSEDFTITEKALVRTFSMIVKSSGTFG